MIKQIEYENKQAIQNDDSIANKNKVTAEDMNEIKNVVNQNAKELETLQEDNQGNETAIETLQNDISLIKQNNSEQDKSIQSNTSKIEAINKSLEAINKKNTEQDTNLQKNVKDIESNQNNIKALQVENAEVKAENERLRSDIESISLPREAEGESIDLDDSSGARFKKFGVSGNHSQETREGYNKFKPFDSSNIINSNGTTVKIQNEKIIINGVCTRQWWCEIYYKLGDGTAVQTDKKENLDSSKTYTFGLQRISGDIIQGYVNATVVIDENDKQIGGVAIETNNKNGTSKTFTGGNGIYRAYLYIPQNAVFNNLEFGVLIYEGSEAKDWEQYGATPSLKFPSEIKTVKDNVNVVVFNKNILSTNVNVSSTRNGITFSYNKDSQIFSYSGIATETSNYIALKVFEELNKIIDTNKKYIFSTSNIINDFNIQLTALNKSNNGTIMSGKQSVQVENLEISIPNGCLLYSSSLVVGKSYSGSFKLQLEEGELASDYVEHEEQAITMPVQQEMLKGDYFDFENEKQSNLFEKITLDGVNKKCDIARVIGDELGFQWRFTVTDNNYDNRRIYSNVATQCNSYGQTNGMVLGTNNNVVYIKSDISLLGGKEATAENVNEILKTMYDNGNPAIFYIEKASNKELDFTDDQKAVAKKRKETLHTYKNITHIYSTDETSPIMNVEYAKDLNTQNNNLQNQIDEIKQLISTTQTSAMLLDNLQKEVESEVE